MYTQGHMTLGVGVGVIALCSIHDIVDVCFGQLYSMASSKFQIHTRDTPVHHLMYDFTLLPFKMVGCH